MGRKDESDYEKGATEPVVETSYKTSMDFNGNGESSFEFWPVQHPSEPPEEDRPVECPMPAGSSVINASIVSCIFKFNVHMHQLFPCTTLSLDFLRKVQVLIDKVSCVQGNGKLQQKFSERLQRNSAAFNTEKRLDRVLPIQATRKRHHREQMTKPLLGRHSLDQFLPPRNITMFQMLNKFDS
ncbi:unnamed protein product [Fraxinus pennsylvanica]|uniref:Uncharacterized protein n=1 Tax=Fraxinus pennsylvanica TaxID=56036 RepID=A0AAD1Z7L3_9LAMI|nr:unnamed protein product [Fraxinus pennsylvanica]